MGGQVEKYVIILTGGENAGGMARINGRLKGSEYKLSVTGLFDTRKDAEEFANTFIEVSWEVFAVSVMAIPALPFVEAV